MRIRIDRANLAAAQVREDLSVVQLAEKAGLSRTTVTAVRSGKSVSRDTADKLAAVLGPSIIQQDQP